MLSTCCCTELEMADFSPLLGKSRFANQFSLWLYPFCGKRFWKRSEKNHPTLCGYRDPDISVSFQSFSWCPIVYSILALMWSIIMSSGVAQYLASLGLVLQISVAFTISSVGPPAKPVSSPHGDTHNLHALPRETEVLGRIFYPVGTTCDFKASLCIFQDTTCRVVGLCKTKIYDQRDRLSWPHMAVIVRKSANRHRDREEPTKSGIIQSHGPRNWSKTLELVMWVAAEMK